MLSYDPDSWNAFNLWGKGYVKPWQQIPGQLTLFEEPSATQDTNRYVAKGYNGGYIIIDDDGETD